MSAGSARGLDLQPELAAKQVEILLETVPGRRHVAVLVNRTSAGTPPMLRAITVAAERFRLTTTVVEVQRLEDFDTAFDAIVRSGADALLVRWRA